MARSGDTVFIGGSFYKIYEPGSASANIAKFNANTGVFYAGERISSVPINDAVPDGQGGFYICSSNEMKIGDSVRSRLAHIDSMGLVTLKCRNIFTAANINRLGFQNNTLYISGDFTSISDSTQSVQSRGAAFSILGQSVLKGFPNPTGAVNTVIPDGQGGWYIGGSFYLTQNGNLRTSAAHIDSLGNILPWNPYLGTGSIVNQLALSDSGTVYIAGNFTEVRFQSRSNLAEVDAITGLPTPWKPAITGGQVLSLVVKDSLVYINGMFSGVGGLPRNKLAAVRRTTGAATSFNPGIVGSSLAKMALKDSLLFIGGVISSLGGQARNNMASVNIYTGSVTGWNPVFSSAVQALAINGDRLYVGGSFNTVNGIDRKGIVSFDLPSYTINLWNPRSNANVSSIAFTDDKVIVCGSFKHIGGFTHNGIAILDTINGFSTGWDNSITTQTYNSVAVSKNRFYVGAQNIFTGGGKTRSSLAAIDVNTGSILDFNPSVDIGSSISKIFPADSVIYVSGDFTTIRGVIRPVLAALSAQSGATTGWVPVSSFPIGKASDLILKDSLLYLTTSDTLSLGRAIQAYNIRSGIEHALPIVIKGNATNIVASGNNVFISGVFDTVNGQRRINFVAVNLTSGSLSSWDPGLTSTDRITAMNIHDSMLYISGIFNAIRGKDRKGLASLHIGTGQVSEWNPGSSSLILPTYNKICFSRNNGCIVGSMTEVGGRRCKNLAAFNIRTNEVYPWAPEVSDNVSAIAVSNNKVYVSGPFTSANGIPRSNFAVFDSQVGILDSLNPSPDYPAGRFVVKDSLLFASGPFSVFGGAPRNRIAVINTITGNLTSWNPPAFNGAINSMTLSDSLLYVGGNFTQIGANPRHRLASLRLSDASLTDWAPDVNNSVYVIGLSGNLLFAGGSFTEVGAETRRGVAAVDPHTGVLKGWNPLFNGNVYGFAITKNKMYAIGQFSMVGSNARRNHVCIRMDDATTTTWRLNTAPLGILNANPTMKIFAFDDKILISGYLNISIDRRFVSGLVGVTEDTTNVPLPVKLLSFTVKKTSDSDVELKWITASEKNSSHFIVERSIDAETFKNIAHMKAAGNSHSKTSYATNDQRSNNEPVIYYRLRQVDMDGTETLSPMISVSFKEKEEISMYPNPSSGWVYFSHTSSHISECSVFDLNGREMKQFILQQNGLTMIDCSHLEAGLYFVKVSNEAETKTMRLFISK